MDSCYRNFRQQRFGRIGADRRQIVPTGVETLSTPGSVIAMSSALPDAQIHHARFFKLLAHVRPRSAGDLVLLTRQHHAAGALVPCTDERKRPMTIAAGFVCSDGLVRCADTELSTATVKFQGRKTSDVRIGIARAGWLT